jgi:RNA polymerase sigma-70 factor (ECF subfamily)
MLALATTRPSHPGFFEAPDSQGTAPPRPGRGPAPHLAGAIAAARSDLLHRAQRMVGFSDAEDLVQSTLERALQHASRFQSGTDLGAWLRRIMSNLLVDEWRRRKPHCGGSLETEPAPAPEPQPAWRELTSEDVDAAVPKLPPRLRAVFELHHEGASYAEIARRLNILPTTVGTRLMRARRRLRRLLSEPSA